MYRVVDVLRSIYPRISGLPAWFRWTAAAFLLLAALLFLDVFRYAFYPDVSVLATKDPQTTAMMREREAEWARGHKKMKISRQWVSLNRISPALVSAVLIAEDDKFWSHEGFDLEGIEKAMEKNIRRRRLSAGGSTITQQLAKNLYLSPSRNPIRKLQEAILTWRLEHDLKKRRILELYLNVAEWGDGIFGIEAAARQYYGVSASELGPYEAARLAAVLPNPRKYSPTGGSRYVENRTRVIYNIMKKRGVVPPDVAELVRGGKDAPAGPAASEGAEGSMENATGIAPDAEMENATSVAPESAPEKEGL